MPLKSFARKARVMIGSYFSIRDRVWEIFFGSRAAIIFFGSSVDVPPEPVYRETLLFSSKGPLFEEVIYQFWLTNFNKPSTAPQYLRAT